MKKVKTQMMIDSATAVETSDRYAPLDPRRSFILSGTTGSDYSYVFDGAADYITVPSDPTLELSNNMSASTWINPDDLGAGNKYYFGYWGASGSRCWCMQVSQNDGTIFLLISQDGAAFSTTTTTLKCTLEDWNHVAFTFASGSLKVYINSVLDSTTALAQTAIKTGGTTTLLMGGLSPSTPSYTGKMNECSIYDVVLSQTDITTLYNGGLPFDSSAHSLSADAVAYYRCGDNISGTTEPDEINSNDGTLVSMTSSDRSLGAGSVSCDVEVSNDGTNFIINKTLKLSPTVSEISCVMDEPWKYVRGNLTSVSGAGTTATLKLGNTIG